MLRPVFLQKRAYAKEDQIRCTQIFHDAKRESGSHKKRRESKGCCCGMNEICDPDAERGNGPDSSSALDTARNDEQNGWTGNEEQSQR
jgi:hypothetical protein